MADPPRRSSAARDRIIAAARPLFAQRGYGRTTLRAIAEAAGVNLALVIRYCGSKEGLFAAVTTLDLQVDRLASVPSAALGRALVGHVLDLWEGEESGPALAALVRATMTDDAARLRVAEQFSGQLARFFSVQDPSVVLAAPMIATQIIGLTMARYIWRLPFVVSLNRQQVVERFGEAVQRHIENSTSLSS